MESQVMPQPRCDTRVQCCGHDRLGDGSSMALKALVPSIVCACCNEDNLYAVATSHVFSYAETP